MGSQEKAYTNINLDIDNNTPESIQPIVEERESRQAEAESSLESQMETMGFKARKTNKRIQIEPEHTATILPNPPIQPVELPDEDAFDLNQSLTDIQYENPQKPTTFVLCPMGTHEAKPGQASGDQLAARRNPPDFADLARPPDWMS